MNKENLLRARSNIIFILALAVGFALVMWIEKHSGPPQAAGASGAARAEPIQYSSDLPAPAAPKALSDQEREWARIAWKYFERNTDPKTGLVNSVDKYPAATMWDTGSSLLALISARRLDLLTEREFDARMSRLLDSLGRMPLYDGLLPNKSYSTATLDMVDYAGKPAAQGIGWSAIDIGRMLVPLSIVAWNFPRHAEAARRVVGRWQLARMSRDGVLVGVHRGEGGKLELLQEGRLGYEQYAAKAAALLGTDAAEALDYKAQLEFAEVYGIRVPHDRRDARTSGGHNYVVSEPYLLDGLEFGGDRISREFAWRVFRAQEERFRQTGKLTAVTEDHVDQAPYFVYNTVYSNGKAWNALTEDGEDASRLRSLSVKAAFGWHALYRNDYTGRLLQEVGALHDPERGWYAGKYEEGGAANKALTANTNAVVLESLAYIAGGRLLGHAQGEKP